jgi:hypothetical protein
VADSDSGRTSASADDKALRGWRKRLRVHPAADLFPLMSEDELRELGDDIKKNGQRVQVIFFSVDGPKRPAVLIDGRNRLDAMELVGLPIFNEDGYPAFDLRFMEGDPYDLVLSLNINRRHLTEEQRRELIAKIIKAKPQASDRSIAKQVKRDHKTVAKVRKKLESTGEVSPVQKRVGADGKQRKSRAPRPKVVAPSPKPVEHRVNESAEVSVEQRRAETAALDQPAETAVDEVDRRASCVANTIRRHVDGLLRSDAARFLSALRDRIDDIEREILRDADNGVVS